MALVLTDDIIAFKSVPVISLEVAFLQAPEAMIGAI
jgi:hypothetical protein